MKIFFKIQVFIQLLTMGKLDGTELGVRMP